jgi:hypothetical protein
MRQLLREVLSPGYAHQTALVALLLLSPAAMATFDLAEGVAPMLVLWAVVALMAVAVRRTELMLAAALGAALTLLALVLRPEHQRALVIAFMLLIAASVGLWARAAALPGSGARFSAGRVVFATLGLLALAGFAFVVGHRNSGPPRRYLAAALHPVHMVMFWQMFTLYGALLFPASALPWVMLFIVGGLINYSIAHYCAFTVAKHWLLTGEPLWTPDKNATFKLQPINLIRNLAVLFLIALVRYARHCKGRGRSNL